MSVVVYFDAPDTDEHLCVYELLNPVGIAIDWAIKDAEVVFQVEALDGYYVDSSLRY